MKDNAGELILQARDVSKHFGGVQALKKVRFDLRQGEIHALVGENGAGKSTLIKILSGLYARDEGEIVYCGKPFSCDNVMEARSQGIGLVPQHIELAESLSVAENIYMGLYPRTRLGAVDWNTLYRKAEEIAILFGMEGLVKERVKNLSTGYRQMVEILRALVFDTKIFAFDEPTASLSEDESQRLFDLIRGLKAKGIAIIYVSHRLEELFQIADRFTVFKDGTWVGTFDVKDVSKESIVGHMVGREISLFGTDTRKNKVQDQNVLEVRDLNAGLQVKNISFRLRKHEILGFFGMVGSGRTETALSIFGAEPKESGEILMNGSVQRISSPVQAVRCGIGLVPENRVSQGLILRSTVQVNITLPFFGRLGRFGLRSQRREREVAKEYMKLLSVKAPTEETTAGDLSGGNQQKVVIAKWLASQASIIIFDEPTHGIDVGAKHDIYQLLRELADSGKGVIMISSELPEVLNVCDRILVFKDGRIVKELETSSGLSEAEVAKYAIG